MAKKKKPTSIPRLPLGQPNGAAAKGKSPKFVTSFRHWRSGEILDARDYGHRAWPIG